jgi:hypothetical protein
MPGHKLKKSDLNQDDFDNLRPEQINNGLGKKKMSAYIGEKLYAAEQIDFTAEIIIRLF